VQIEVKFIAPLKGSRKKHYQFTAIDDCTRIRMLRVYDRLNQQSAIRFLDYVLEKLPFTVQVIQTDNGAEFRRDACPSGRRCAVEESDGGCRAFVAR
jgi:transposase-like protein